MANKVENRTIKVLINEADLKKKLEENIKRSERLSQKLQTLDKGSLLWKQTNEELEKVNKNIAKYSDVLSGKVAPTQRMLEQEQKRLNKELKEMPINMRAGSEQAKKLGQITGILYNIRQEQNKVNAAFRTMGDSDAWLNRLKTGIASVFGGNLLFSGFNKLKDIAAEGVEYSKQLEVSADNLSALTGLAGSELDYLKKQAKELSQSTVEGNIRITKSALDIQDAYTIVGSQRPELLKNKEALAEVTKQALILSEAAKIDLQTAVKGVTTSLNQFNMAGDQAGRISNVLAAGSKVGAANVEYQAQALEKSGTAMKFSNLQIEEGIGLIQTLAPKFAQPEMAGTNLRNVLLKLEQAADKNLRPSIVGLIPALETLRSKQWDTTKMVQFFGAENITAAAILRDSVDDVKNYTQAVTDTSVAIEQAGINTNNDIAKQQQARNEWLNNAAVLGSKLSPAITSVYTTLSKFTQVLINLPQIIKENTNTIISLVGLYYSLNAAKLVNIATTIREYLLLRTGIGLKIKDNLLAAISIIRTEALTAAQAKQTVVGAALAGTLGALRATYLLLLGPIGLVIAAITGLVLLLRNYENITGESAKAEKHSAKLKKDLTTANEALKKSLDELNKTSAKYSSMTHAELNDTRNLIKSKIDEAKARLENYKARQIEAGLNAAKPTLFQQTVNALNPNTFNLNNSLDALENSNEASARFDDSINEMSSSLSQLEAKYSDVTDLLNAESIGDNLTNSTIGQLEEKVQQYTLALKQLEKGSDDFIRVQKKLQQAEKLLSSGSVTELSDSEQKKAIADREKFLQKLQELGFKNFTQTLSQNEAELASIKHHYDNLRKEAGTALKDKNELQKVLGEIGLMEQKDISAKQQEQWEKDKDELDKLFAETLKDADNHYQALKKLNQSVADASAKSASAEAAARYEMLQKTVADESLSTETRIEARRKVAQEAINTMDAEQTAQRKSLEEQLKNLELTPEAHAEIAAQIVDIDSATAARRLLIEQILDADIASIEKNAFERRIQAVESFAGQASGIYNSLNQVTLNNEQGQLNTFIAARDAELQKLDDLKDKKLLNDVDYNARKKVIEDKFRRQEAEIKTKQFERQKTADTIQAIINTAVAVTKAFAQFGFPAGILPAALAAAAGGAQVAAIQSQKAPKFGRGADLRNKGVPHSNPAGGNPIIDPITGQVIGYVEAGEVLLSKNTVDNNRMAVDKLLFSSLYQNGAPVQLPQFSFPTISQSAPRFQNGTIISAPPVAQSSISTAQNARPLPTPIGSNDSKELLATLQLQNKLLTELINKGIKAKAVFGDDAVRDISDRQDDFSAVGNNTNL